ncbi:hypothetical protein ACFQ73_00995 [Amycolatopsis japonica]|uniref:hypothetical protein n=1 Tax=Amycolatopsis japonica TaxID=208439 RepID=UPI00366CE6EC
MVTPAVDVLEDLADGPVLEFAVGTGRIPGRAWRAGERYRTEPGGGGTYRGQAGWRRGSFAMEPGYVGFDVSPGCD